MLANWSTEIYVKREKQIWRYEMKEKKTMATLNKSSWTILISAFGTSFVNHLLVEISVLYLQ